MSTGKHVFGFGNISVNLDADLTVSSINGHFVTAAQGFKKSTEKLLIGGVPLTLYQNGLGVKALGVTYDNSAIVNSSQKFITLFGDRFAVKQLHNAFVLPIHNSSTASITSDEIVLQGEPIGEDTSKDLLFYQVSLPSFSSIYYSFNGNVMLAREYNNDKYMVICNQ